MNAVARRNRTGMEKSRTLVLVATMRSPTTGSPDQTYLRARCAKLGRPRRATAPRFSRMRGRTERGQRTYLCPDIEAMSEPQETWLFITVEVCAHCGALVSDRRQ